jgi:hypothetical protein
MDERAGADVVERILLGPNIQFKTSDANDSVFGGDVWPAALENGSWFLGHLSDPTVYSAASNSLYVRINEAWLSIDTTAP